jgi:diguanylate cyclase (GGDEF)-like protein/PAS domain S-box-containing protein
MDDDYQNLIGIQSRFNRIESMLNDVIRCSGGWVWELDNLDRFIYTDGAYKQLLGYHKNEIIGKTLYDIMASDDVEALREAITLRKTNKHGLVEFIHWIDQKDGNRICLLTNAVPLLDETGTVTGFRGLSQDVTLQKNVELAVFESEEKHRTLLNSIGSPVLALDRQFRILFCNQEYADFVGMAAEDITEKNLLTLFPEFSSTKTFHGYIKALSTNDKQVVEGHYFDRYLRVNIFPHHWGILAISEDITDQKQIEIKLAEQESIVRAIVKFAAEGIIVISENGTIESFNTAAERIFGYEFTEIAGKDISILMPEPVKSNHKRYMQDFIRTGKGKIFGQIVEVVGLRKNGSTFPVEIAASEVRIDGVKKFTGIIRDITDRKLLENQMKYEASYDGLTGLYNRHHFMKLLSEEIKTARRHRYPLSLCVCDADDFKHINDTYGHQTGDEAIRCFASVIERCLREGDWAGRFGGDEFVILLRHTNGMGARIAAERIRKEIEEEPFTTSGGTTIPLAATFGIAQLIPEHKSRDDLFRDADTALYQAKESGRNCVVVFSVADKSS